MNNNSTKLSLIDKMMNLNHTPVSKQLTDLGVGVAVSFNKPEFNKFIKDEGIRFYIIGKKTRFKYKGQVLEVSYGSTTFGSEERVFVEGRY